ncbi:MAG TPA: deaminase [Streptosporangiaceae bacterium]|nr:deaminase [Streptosporangiaceae bacterium]
MKQVLLYLPVIHSGYEAFLRRHADAAEILLLGSGFTDSYPSLAKDIRALPPERAAEYLRLAAGSASIRVVQPAGLAAAVTGDPLVLPDEEIMRDIAARHDLGTGRSLVFDRTFLRWDRDWATAASPVDFDGEITAADLPGELLGRAQTLSERSSDWWRQVGAVAVRDGQVLGCAWNHHHPTEYAPYLNGDPRDAFERGMRADLSTAIHAEAALIAGAARDGTSLAGADLYTTTFPCPACARLIAEAGFVRCLFAGRYSVLDGEQTLRARGISLIWVDTRAGR